MNYKKWQNKSTLIEKDNVMKSFKTKLNINNRQRTKFLQHSGTARHAWNWGLALCRDLIYKKEKTPTAIDLHKLLVKDVKSVNEWYYEVSKCSPQEALRDLYDAFYRFWKQHKINKTLPMNKRYLRKYLLQKQRGEIKELRFEHEKGFPRFKKKGQHDSFYLAGAIQIDGNKIKVPKIGWLKTYEILPIGVKPSSCVISRTANDWFIAFKTEAEPTIIKHNTTTSVGVDLGIKTLATLSDGTIFQSPKPYKKQKKKLRRLQRKQCRQREVQKKSGLKKVSNNYVKTKKKIEKVHQRITNVRKDNTHKLTSYLVKSHNKITIEDLNVSGMVKNHNLASSILDGGFFEFKRQLEYKCKWNSVELVVANRWFASSQTCSCCGHKQKMPLKERVFNCEKCGLKIDRDLNAAINLNNYTPSYGVKAGGDAKFHDASQVSINEAGIRQQTSHVQVCIGS